MTDPETADAEPLQTGRPTLSHNMTIVAFTLYGIAPATVAVMAAAPALVPKLWVWGIIGGAFVFGGIATIVASAVRPVLTTTGKIVAIDQEMDALAARRAALAGADAPVRLDAADLAAIEALRVQMAAEGVGGAGPREHTPA